MKYLILLLMATTAQAASKDQGKAVFQVACERTYFKITAEYFEGTDVGKVTQGFTSSCKTMAEKYNMEFPVQLGCSMAIKQMRITKPSLPSGDDMYKKFCSEVAELI